MEEKRPTSTGKSSPINMIAAVIYALLAFFQIFTVLDYVHLFNILMLASYALLAYSFFKKDRGLLMIVGFGIFAILSLIDLFRYIEYMNFPQILSALLPIFMLLLATICLTNYVPQLQNIVRKLWFLPGALSVIPAISTILNFLRFFFYYPGELTLNVFFALLDTASLIFAGLWIAYPEGFPNAKRPQSADSSDTATPDISSEEGYCSLVKHILLLIFTLGIWNLIWIYRTTRFLNRVKGTEYRDPTKKLLLCMFIPFYSIYWTYKSAQRVDKLAKSVGISSDLSTLCLILAFFVGIVPPILLQDKINAIVNVETGATQPDVKPNNTSSADEIKKFKELLDSGAITQEEYDSKKKELLGL